MSLRNLAAAREPTLQKIHLVPVQPDHILFNVSATHDTIYPTNYAHGGKCLISPTTPQIKTRNITTTIQTTTKPYVYLIESIKTTSIGKC